MRYLPLTLKTPAENLALDEALLDAAEAGKLGTEGVLRVWESPTYCVVLGRSSKPEVEVQLDACQQDGIPVLRRSSGGGTILAGPGCLMYAVVLSLREYPQLRAIDQAHHFTQARLSQMLSTDGATILSAGTSDLTIRPGTSQNSPSTPALKFSGNAMRLKRDHLLYHGTLLYDFDLTKIARWLATPTRTPVYRNERTHTEFVMNLKMDRVTLTQLLVTGWQANEELAAWPEKLTAAIANSKYQDDPRWVIHSPQTEPSHTELPHPEK